MFLTMSSCCSRRRGKQHRRLLIPSKREKPHSLRLLPARAPHQRRASCQRPPQAAIPALMFCCRCEMLMTQTSFNLPPPPPSTSASNYFRPLLVSVTISFERSISFTHSLSQTHTLYFSLLSYTHNLSLSLLCVSYLLFLYFKMSYPISTLPEHLHSTSLSYAETT